jgi:hypothetical protein
MEIDISHITQKQFHTQGFVEHEVWKLEKSDGQV